MSQLAEKDLEKSKEEEILKHYEDRQLKNEIMKLIKGKPNDGYYQNGIDINIL